MQVTGVNHITIFHITKEHFGDPMHRGGGETVSVHDPDDTELELFTGMLEKQMKVWA
jgi:hypothetical protein